MTIKEEILDSLPIAVIFLDEGGEVSYANQRAMALLDLAREAIVGQPLFDLLPPYSFPAYGILQEPRQTDGSWCGTPAQFAPPSPEEPPRRQLRYRLFPVSLSADQVNGAVVILEDPGFPVSTSTSLADSWQTTGYNVPAVKTTHELNQHLQVVIGYLSLMSLELWPDHPAQRYLEKIQNQMENILALCQKLSHNHPPA
jgi:hypothetical protein